MTQEKTTTQEPPPQKIKTNNKKQKNKTTKKQKQNKTKLDAFLMRMNFSDEVFFFFIVFLHCIYCVL